MEQVFGYIIGLGAAVMMPIIFTLFRSTFALPR